MSLCDEFCAGCRYYGKAVGNCDYIFIVKHPRGCTAGTGCTRRVEGKHNLPQYRKYKQEEKALLAALGLARQAKPKIPSVMQRKEKKRMALYRKGLTDQQIADVLGMSKSGVSNWRLRNKLPVNPYKHIDLSEVL